MMGFSITSPVCGSITLIEAVLAECLRPFEVV
jgi:hypothetical protein